MEERRYYRIERRRHFRRTWLMLSGVMFCAMALTDLWLSQSHGFVREIAFSVLWGGAMAWHLGRGYSVAIYADRLESHGFGWGGRGRTVFRDDRLRVHEARLGVHYDRHRSLKFTNHGRFLTALYGFIFIPEYVDGYEQLRSEFLAGATQSNL